jgi:hypothetical protein
VSASSRVGRPVEHDEAEPDPDAREDRDLAGAQPGLAHLGVRDRGLELGEEQEQRDQYGGRDHKTEVTRRDDLSQDRAHARACGHRKSYAQRVAPRDRTPAVERAGGRHRGDQYR